MEYPRYANIFGSAILLNRNLNRKWLLVLTLCSAVIFGVIAPNLASAVDYPMTITIENNSGFEDTNIYLLCTGSNQTGPAADDHFGYLNFANNTFVETGKKTNFSLNISAMTTTLQAVKNGNNTYSINVPAIVSGRLYFAFGDNFDKCPDFGAYGPQNGAVNTVVYDKFEFDTWDNPNINITNVDFFGISYYVTVTEASTGNPVQRGYLTSRDSVFDAFKNVPGNTNQLYGNTSIFDALSITRAAKDKVTKVRVLAPKNAAYSDFNISLANAQQKCSHFFDQYVNNQCWKAGREFSFYSKFYKKGNSGGNDIYYGRVSADGMTLYLYTDANRTVPYQVPSLPRPSSSNILFPGPTQWHHVDSAKSDEIDWGFLLGGQSAGVNQGAYWATDPVVMAITISIARGVMHYDDGTVKWTDSSKYYGGAGAVSSADYPVYYYGQLIHDLSIDKLSYSLSYDDIYGTDPSVYFRGYPNVTLTLNSVVPSVQAIAKLSVSTKSLYVGTESDTTSFAVSNAGTGTTGWTAEVTSGGSWLRIISGASGADVGTVTCAFDKNTTTDFRVGIIRIAAEGAAGSPVDVTVTQAPASTACTATIDGNIFLQLQIPYLSYVDPISATSTLFWADFVYDFNPAYPALIIFRLLNFDSIKNPSFSCAASTLSSDFKIHIPDVLLPDGYTHIWVDLEFIPVLSTDNDAYFIVTNFG
jgi:hypothetical protein